MFATKKTILGPVPKIPFERIASAILGEHFELSLVICGKALARKMNKKYRHTSYAPNVLSFPISKHEGEIFLNVRKAAGEAKQFGMPLKDRLAHLFVHGCFHLRGLDHGKKMESAEERILEKFGFARPLE